MRLVRRTAVVTAVALAVSAWPASADTAVVSRGVTIPTFYNVPATLPSANGALVKSEPMKIAWWQAGLFGSFPATATRVMFRTTDSNGQAAAVTGAYLEPKTAWTGPGARPLVVLAPGTQGQGDQCSASLGIERGVTVTSDTMAVGYENIATNKLLSKGVAVMVTDYIGLGTTDRLHTYVNRLDQGHAVLDAARAAKKISGASVTADSKVGIYGYSQGGGAAGSAAELQPSYAPDVKLAGAAVGAPPADLKAVSAGIDGSTIVGTLAFTSNGLRQSYPSLKPYLDENTSAAGKAAAQDLSTRCVGDAALSYAFTKSSKWTTTGETFSQLIARNPLAAKVLDDQKLGRLTPTAPVRVATGLYDDVVPHAQARRLAVDWCGKGANVQYVPVNTLNILPKSALNHIQPMIADLDAATNWLMGRVSGAAAAPNCGSVGSMR